MNNDGGLYKQLLRHNIGRDLNVRLVNQPLRVRKAFLHIEAGP